MDSGKSLSSHSLLSAISCLYSWQMQWSEGSCSSKTCPLFLCLSEILGDCINVWFIDCSLRKISMFQPSSLILQSSSCPSVLHFGSCLYYDSVLSLAREGHDTSPKAIVWLHIHQGSNWGSIFIIQAGFNHYTQFHFWNDHSLPPPPWQWVVSGDNFTYLTCKILRETLGYLLKVTEQICVWTKTEPEGCSLFLWILQ